MSNIANIQLYEWQKERNQGAYERPMVYPEGSIIDGIPIISDVWLNRQAEEREREEMNETLTADNIF